jgi:DNA-binding PadR family transcriptional regulator
MALREVVLTVLARRRMTGYEIARTFDQVLSYFWRASHQQVYRELARLHRQRFVVYEVVPQAGKPNKKVYEITKAGRDELKRWVAEPTAAPRPQYDLLVKLLAGTLVDKQALRVEFARVRSDIAGVMQQFRAFERECLKQPLGKMSEYDQMLYLALRRGLLLGRAQDVWLAEVDDFLNTGRLKR